MIDASNAGEPLGSALSQALRCHHTANELRSTWPCPLMTPSLPLQLLTQYRAQFWTGFVSSLMGDDSTAAAAIQTASSSTRGQQSYDRCPVASQRSAVLRGQFTVCNLLSTQSTDATLTGDGAVRRHTSPVNWLLDSSTSTSATTAASLVAPAFDVASRQLEHMRQCRRFWTDGADDLGVVDARRRHVVCNGRTADGTTLSEAASDAGVDGCLCRLCFGRFATSGAMRMHARTHTRPCRCAVCGKTFSRPWLLRGHIRTHTGERPFSCSFCQRAFADRSNLRAHLQTHAVVKKYACWRCAKTFSRMSLLTKHRNGTACRQRDECRDLER